MHWKIEVHEDKSVKRQDRKVRITLFLANTFSRDPSIIEISHLKNRYIEKWANTFFFSKIITFGISNQEIVKHNYIIQ